MDPERWFGVRERGSTVGRELRGGAVTFVTMSYILFLQPALLSDAAGMDFGAVFVATALSAATATLLMGLWANYPIAQAPLMGENFFFAISVVAVMGIAWPTALGVVFLSGLLFLLLTVLRVREAILDAIPDGLKVSIAAGIGLFIGFIGLVQGGIVAKSPAPAGMVQIGDLGSMPARLTLLGLAVTAVLIARRVRGAILLGMIVTTGVALATGVVRGEGIVSAPPSLTPTLLKMDVVGALAHLDLVMVFLFVLVFDTVGTLIGVGEQAGFMVDGRLPRADRAMLSDAVGTVVGSALGTSTVSSYIESTAGVAEGARTGLANLVTGGLFVAAIFLAPLVEMIGGGVRVGETSYQPIIAPAIVLVGSFMMGLARRVRWNEPTEAIPAFLTMTLIPLTYNPAHGVAAGIVSWVGVKAASGRRREVSPLMWGLALAVVVAYLSLPRLRH